MFLIFNTNKECFNSEWKKCDYIILLFISICHNCCWFCYYYCSWMEWFKLIVEVIEEIKCFIHKINKLYLISCDEKKKKKKARINTIQFDDKMAVLMISEQLQNDSTQFTTTKKTRCNIIWFVIIIKYFKQLVAWWMMKTGKQTNKKNISNTHTHTL